MHRTTSGLKEGSGGDASTQHPLIILFLVHVSGETAWTQPEEMVYRPPIGRDAQGNRIDPTDASKLYQTQTDSWGTPYYENLLTGEKTYEKPAVSDVSGGSGRSAWTPPEVC